MTCRKRICYVTMESLSADPIICSQVVPLLNKVLEESPSIDEINLITFDRKNSESFSELINERFSLTSIEKSGHFFDQIKLCKYIIQNFNRYDIVHVRSYLAMVLVCLFKIFYRYKVVFDPRGLFADEILFYNKKSIGGHFFKLIEPILYSLSDKVVVVSNAFYKYVLKRFKLDHEKVVVIPTFSKAPDIKLFLEDKYNVRSGAFDKNSIIFCYSGSLEGWQKFDTVLDFFEIICSSVKDSRFVFCSKTLAEMRSLVLDKLPEERCKFYSLSPADLSSVMQQCDFGVLFRDRHIINIVAAPIKLNDYLLSGMKVIISTEIGDSSKFVSDNDFGYLVSAFDVESFHKVLPLLSLVGKSEKERIIELVSEFRSIGFAVDSYIKIYDNII